MKAPRLTLLTGLAVFPAATIAQPYAITASTVSCGGTTTPVAAGPYTLVCTIGDPLAASVGTAGAYSLGTGFLAAATGGSPSCYANCDGSTGTPSLTGNDFQCFINAYAGGQSYANCDGSTGTPALTGNDFLCFINAYAAGCS